MRGAGLLPLRVYAGVAGQKSCVGSEMSNSEDITPSDLYGQRARMDASPVDGCLSSEWQRGHDYVPRGTGLRRRTGASNTVAASSREQGDREGNTQAAKYRGAVASALAEKEHLVDAVA